MVVVMLPRCIGSSIADILYLSTDRSIPAEDVFDDDGGGDGGG